MATDNNGVTCDIGHGYLFSYGDKAIGNPKKSWVILDAKIYPIKDGYRPVTEEEMKKYNCPKCAMQIGSTGGEYYDADPVPGWNFNNFYIVPEDFEFEPVYRKPINNDVGKIVEVRDYINSKWEKRKFVGVNREGKFLCWDKNMTYCFVWNRARIKAGE